MDIFSGITTLCFVGSYCVALALEVSRLFFRSRIRRALMLGFAIGGLIAHALYLASRAMQGDSYPLSSPYDWCLVAALVLATTYIYLTFSQPKVGVGLFLLPLLLGLIAAAQFSSDEPLALGRATSAWGLVHGVFLLVGTVTVLIGFSAGLMYLLQASRLKQKLPPSQRLKLPSLEWLERVNSRAIYVSTLMISGGFISGIILNQIKHFRQQDALPWNDPVVLSLGVMLAWLLAASLFSLVYRPARQGRKVAYLTVASIGFLILAIGTLIFTNTAHLDNSQERESPASRLISNPQVIQPQEITSSVLAHPWATLGQVSQLGQISHGDSTLFSNLSMQAPTSQVGRRSQA